MAAHERWLGFSRRAAEGARAALGDFAGTAARAERVGRGEGGDMTLAIDRAAEDAVFEALESMGVGLLAVSEERGHVEIAGGGPIRVVIDPIDGSLNAKRGIPGFSVSLAVAEGDAMDDVVFGYVADLRSGEEWWAERGGGAFVDGSRLGPLVGDGVLEVLGVESAHPRLVAAAADALAATEAARLRMLGSIALTLCFVAGGRFDGMLSLREARSVDAAAGQLIVREAGGAVAFPDAGDLAAPIALSMRSRVLAAATPEMLDRLLALSDGVEQ